MLAKSFCVGMRLMVKHFCSVSSLGMKVGYTSTSQNESDKAWSGATSSLKPKKVRVQRSASKVMLTFFWDYNGPILEHYMTRGSTVTSATYSNFQREKLKPAIRQKQRTLLTTGVCLLHDNAKLHTATATLSPIKELRLECILHPPYSPDLAPSDFPLFGPLKDALSGTQFRDDDEVRSAVHEWLRTRPKEFFSRGIYALVKRWHKYIELEGDYVELY